MAATRYLKIAATRIEKETCFFQVCACPPNAIDENGLLTTGQELTYLFLRQAKLLGQLQGRVLELMLLSVRCVPQERKHASLVIWNWHGPILWAYREIIITIQ